MLNPIVYVAMVDNKIKRVHALRMERDPSTAKEYIPMSHNMFDDEEKDDTLLAEELLIADEEENEEYFDSFWSEGTDDGVLAGEVEDVEE